MTNRSIVSRDNQDESSIEDININEIEKIFRSDDGVDDTTLQALGLDLIAAVKHMSEELVKARNVLYTLACEAGDVPFWNEGGDGYEALARLKVTQ